MRSKGFMSIFIPIFLASNFLVSGVLFAKSKSTKKRKMGNDNWSVIAIDAEYSFDRGDLYQSLRLLELLRAKKIEVFLQAKNLNAYFDSLYLLGSPKKLEQACNEEYSLRKNHRSKIAYYCALTSYRHGEFRQAYQWISKIKDRKASSETVLLSASILLALNSPNKCIKKMNVRKEYGGLSDLAYLLKARCLMEQSNYTQAIDNFLKISPESQHYADALYDLSWAYFKSRQIGDSRSSIDVVLSTFNESDSGKVSIDSLEYFNLRFLKAYLGIVQTGASEVKSSMDLASQEIESLRQRHEFDDKRLQALVSELVSGKKLKDFFNPSPRYGDWYSFVSTWGQLSFLDRSMKDYRHLKAIQIELNRPLDKEYKNALVGLQEVLEKSSRWALIKLYKDSLQALDGFEFRVNLAKLKMDTLKKTKGAQNLKQAKEIYKRKENYIQGLTGDLQ